MPVPVLWVVFAGAAAAAAAVAAALQSRTAQGASKIVVVVGPRDSGKTVMFNLLTEPSSGSPDHISTADTFTFDEREVRLEETEVTVRVVDTPTTKGLGNELRELLSDADLVVFTADASLLPDDRYRDAAESLATTYRLYETEKTRWQLLLTHADHVRPAGRAPDDLGAVEEHEKLAKVLDDEAALLCNLLDPDHAAAAVRRVVEGVAR